MRLCNIKLSGFKSFVDPTNLILPGGLVGIVGPNGCGKSNIIDAVTWVMGESSAKHLRGDSLTDVIFSGSSARQPVGQASVELVFDNTEKKLGGQYAGYNEISIKRQINRDGVSAYFLNGTRCRRRDITAIFLGTGLGPRSYAIIEQGMIARLIEAKPEELRVFIEEAAGISKYRERRRETENRIKHTRENIERLDDIREELEKQLNHLQRQAQAAERYKTLKQNERKLNMELLALNWRDLNKELDGLRDVAGARENAVEAAVAKVRETEAEIERQREQLGEANQHFNGMQSDYYKVGSDIAQYEQKLQHTREKTASMEAELEKTMQALTASLKQHEQDNREYQQLESELNALQPRLHGSRTESNKAYQLLNTAEQAMQSWQIEWDTFNETFTEFTRQEQIDKTHLEHLESGLEELHERRHQLQDEINKIDESGLNDEIERLQSALKQEEQKQSGRVESIDKQQIRVKEDRAKVKQLLTELDDEKQDYRRLKGQLASLETLQRSALENNRELKDWLQKNKLDRQPRLSRVLKINPEWTHALETVAGSRLNDFCVEDISHYLDKLDNAPGSFGLIGKQAGSDTSVTNKYPRLIDEITTDVRIPSVLEHIYLADSLTAAVKMLPDLSDIESVVTRDGVWLGHHWVLVNSTANGSVLNREQEIGDLKSEIIEYESKIHALETALHDTEKRLERSEVGFAKEQELLNTQRETISALMARLAAAETETEQALIRYRQLDDELDNNRQQAATDKIEIDDLKQRLSRTEKEKLALQAQRDELAKVKDKHRESLDSARGRWQNTHEESHGFALQLESYLSRRASYEQAIKRNDIQVAHLQAGKSELEQNLADSRSPVEELQQTIERCLKEKINAENKLVEARKAVQAVEEKMKLSTQNRQVLEQESEKLRAELEQARLGVNSCQVKLETVADQLAANAQRAEDLLSTLDETAQQQAWNNRLESVARKIQRLGPINLAAIDEFTQGSERKSYLDSQHKDLTSALTTLENAIRKIDKETRTRFKETFDELNTNIKDMFPKLFGGGHAYLELTGDDLLQTGVAVMARPPGKKNSNIHLLSGGEKALTAVALVFAIFKLNPAPFCILDEVDAPLDDTNVGRFSELVHSMSEDVQFIFITHNKITMEIANQLLGVTMHEAGVSRLVSVDMDEAVEMAASA